MTRHLGAEAETIALHYLQARGLTLLARNYYSRFGEIDLVMQDQSHVVFVEVRHRHKAAFGGALESITPSKQRKLRNTATIYLLQHFTTQPPCRFDIICLQGGLTSPEIQWLNNAF